MSGRGVGLSGRMSISLDEAQELVVGGKSSDWRRAAGQRPNIRDVIPNLELKNESHYCTSMA